MGKAWAIFVDAANHFVAEDGWAIASHIALSTLTSLFPFLIFVTALAGFLGRKAWRTRRRASSSPHGPPWSRVRSRERSMTC